MLRRVLIAKPRLAACVAGAAGLAASASTGCAIAEQVDQQEVEYAIREALISKKVNACPMAIRVAWHSSGTYDKVHGSSSNTIVSAHGPNCD